MSDEADDRIPDLTFLRPTGAEVKLSDLLEADRTLLLFLRHFA
jgi:hypothetical protein